MIKDIQRYNLIRRSINSYAVDTLATVVKIDLANNNKQLPGTVSAEIVDVPVQKA